MKKLYEKCVDVIHAKCKYLLIGTGVFMILLYTLRCATTAFTLTSIMTIFFELVIFNKNDSELSDTMMLIFLPLIITIIYVLTHPTTTIFNYIP